LRNKDFWTQVCMLLIFGFLFEVLGCNFAVVSDVSTEVTLLDKKDL